MCHPACPTLPPSWTQGPVLLSHEMFWSAGKGSPRRAKPQTLAESQSNSLRSPHCHPTCQSSVTRELRATDVSSSLLRSYAGHQLLLLVLAILLAHGSPKEDWPHRNSDGTVAVSFDAGSGWEEMWPPSGQGLCSRCPACGKCFQKVCIDCVM